MPLKTKIKFELGESDNPKLTLCAQDKKTELLMSAAKVVLLSTGKPIFRYAITLQKPQKQEKRGLLPEEWSCDAGTAHPFF